MTIDWQNIALLLIVGLCGIVWAEVRALRKAKHSDSQVLQWCVFAIGMIAKKTNTDLPELKRE